VERFTLIVRQKSAAGVLVAQAMKANSRERQVGNCWQAYKRVKTNKGSPGIDGIKVGDLSGYLKQHWPTMKELAAYLRGWKSYFGFCQTPSLLKALDQWIRHRLRSVIWETVETRAATVREPTPSWDQ